jgi:gamma-glutamylcyclotransferase (GGCT)/AIG2-like uncharacterized protein YtfP
MDNLFTYGSLMSSDIMYTIAGCRADFVSATLRDFQRSSIRGEEYPGIVAHPQAEVEGVLYLDLSAKAMQRLDNFEGEQYARQEVQVMTQLYGLYTAMAYVIKPEYTDLLTGETWDYERFLAVGKSEFLKTYIGFRKI